MRTRAGVTAAVAVLSLFGSAAGHALVSGHPVAPSALPQLGLLAAVCFLLAGQRLRTPSLVAALSLVQATVHLVLAQSHHLTAPGGTASSGTSAVRTAPGQAMTDHSTAGHSMAGHASAGPMAGHGMAGHEMAGMPGMGDAAGQTGGGIDTGMLVMHLGAMLGTLWLLAAAGRWWERLVVALGRVVPALPRMVHVTVDGPGLAAYAVVPVPSPQRWLPTTVLRRGPPER